MKKVYDKVVFPPQVLVEAVGCLRTVAGKANDVTRDTRSITLLSGETWKHDSDDEFFADYRQGFQSADFGKTVGHTDCELLVQVHSFEYLLQNFRSGDYQLLKSAVTVAADKRSDVQKVFSIFESNAEKYRVPEPRNLVLHNTQVKVFIGHGRNQIWRDLKDHLHEKQGYNVEAYEIGARAGLTIRDVLDDMLTNSYIAFLVMTAEDEDAQGRLHARENVIHELGLFQGRLGWRRAIVVLEEGTEEFSNILGTHQIRFHRGSIQEVYGEVMATIRREFP